MNPKKKSCFYKPVTVSAHNVSLTFGSKNGSKKPLEPTSKKKKSFGGVIGKATFIFYYILAFAFRKGFSEPFLFRPLFPGLSCGQFEVAKMTSSMYAEALSCNKFLMYFLAFRLTGQNSRVVSGQLISP
jgi:hypothetical protein